MKINEYNQMMAYLTRPGEVMDKKSEEQMIKQATQPEDRGVFQRLVKENEAAKLGQEVINKSNVKLSNTQKKEVMKAVQPEEKLFENIIDNLGKPKPKPYYVQNLGNGKLENVNAPDWKSDTRDLQDKRGTRFINKTLKTVEKDNDPRGVAFNSTTQLFTNKDRTIAFKTYDEADTWNKAIGQRDKDYPTQASPEQVGRLAERLERNAQMTGGKGPSAAFTKKPKAIIKKKIIHEPVKMNFNFQPEIAPIRAKTAEEIQLDNNFNKLLAESRQRELDRETGGLAGLIKPRRRF